MLENHTKKLKLLSLDSVLVRDILIKVFQHQYRPGSYFGEGSASYSIIDMATNESVVPFSQYTTMSCDTISPYFKQDLNGFEPYRAYKILIKVKHNDNQTLIYDDDFEFILRV